MRLLTQVEVGLSRWCVLELDPGTQALEILSSRISLNREPTRLNANQIDQIADLDAYWRLWGRWLGREHEFYRECARLVNDLSWEDIIRICGPEVLMFTRLVPEGLRSSRNLVRKLIDFDILAAEQEHPRGDGDAADARSRSRESACR